MFIFASILLIFKTILGLRSAGGGAGGGAKKEDVDSGDESSLSSARSVRTKRGHSLGEESESNFSLQGSEDNNDASSEFSLPRMRGFKIGEETGN